MEIDEALGPRVPGQVALTLPRWVRSACWFYLKRMSLGMSHVAISTQMVVVLLVNSISRHIDTNPSLSRHVWRRDTSQNGVL
jgi:hypothetical protein